MQVRRSRSSARSLVDIERTAHANFATSPDHNRFLVQRTFEGYYRDETSFILNNVITWLSTNPTGKFIWVETSFLQRWWLDQNASTQATFQSLLDAGRLELVGGGWTMHDEESTNAYSAVTNMEYGLTWLQDTFGAANRPRFLWHIDPSGHAAITPTLAAELGFDALVLDRVPDPVRQAFRQNLSLQFVWTAVNTTANASPSILAMILELFYCNPSIGGNNVSEQAVNFYNDIVRRSEMLRPDENGHVTVLFPWGCDFAFQHMSDFDLLTGVLGYMDANAGLFPNITARFGTLSDYFDTLHGQNIAWPTQGKRDFHPYVWCYEPDNPNLCFNLPSTPDPAYWRSGMYTSKVGLKGLSRVQDASLNAGDGLYAIVEVEGSLAAAAAAEKRAAPSTGLSNRQKKEQHLRGDTRKSTSKPSSVTVTPHDPSAAWLALIGLGRSTSSLMTHHDAITGTAYISCSLGPPDDDCDCFDDYMARMARALNATEVAAGSMKGWLLTQPPQRSANPVVFDNATTASATWTAGSVLVVAVSNPLAWPRREMVRMPLLGAAAAPSSTITVTDLRTNTAVASQVVIDGARGGEAVLYWLADVPSLGVTSYSLTFSSSTTDAQASSGAGNAVVSGQAYTMSNGYISIAFDATGRLSSWSNATSGITIPFDHSFYYYQEKVAGGDLIGGTVYGFDPMDDKHPVLLGAGPNGTDPGRTTSFPLVVTASGPLVWQVSQLINGYIVHTVRLFAGNTSAGTDSSDASYAAALPLSTTIEFQTLLDGSAFPVGLTSDGLGQGGSIVSALTPGQSCLPPDQSNSTSNTTTQASAYTRLTTDSSGFQTLHRPAYDVGQYAQGQVYPSWPGWDWEFGPCTTTTTAGASSTPGAAAVGSGVLSHIMQRPTGAAVMSNTTVWNMMHRRLINAMDDRGNDTTVLDEVVTLSIADETSRWEGSGDGNGGYLLQRQVQGRLIAHPLSLHGAVFPSVSSYLAVATPSYQPTWVNGSLPTGLHLHSLLSRDRWYPAKPANGSDAAASLAAGTPAIALRLQQLPYAPPVSFDVSSWLSVSSSNIAETTPDFNVGKAASDAKRLVWRTLDDAADRDAYIAQAAAAGGEDKHVREGETTTFGDRDTTATFDAEYIRSYVVTLN